MQNNTLNLLEVPLAGIMISITELQYFTKEKGKLISRKGTVKCILFDLPIKICSSLIIMNVNCDDYIYICLFYIDTFITNFAIV